MQHATRLNSFLIGSYGSYFDLRRLNFACLYRITLLVLAGEN